jgi:hypothetical protein
MPVHYVRARVFISFFMPTTRRRRNLTVIEAELETGKSQELFSTELPGLSWVHGHAIAISGHLLGCVIYWHPTQSYAILLVNWQTQEYVLILHPGPHNVSPSTLEFVGGSPGIHICVLLSCLQQLAVPKARIEKVLFWDVFKEFPISQWVLHRFT